MKLDSARGIDQGDLTRMLGRLSASEIERTVRIVERHHGDPTPRRMCGSTPSLARSSICDPIATASDDGRARKRIGLDNVADR